MRPSVVLLVGIGLLYLLYKGRLGNVLTAVGSGGDTGSTADTPAAPPDPGSEAASCPDGYYFAAPLGRCVPLNDTHQPTVPGSNATIGAGQR